MRGKVGGEALNSATARITPAYAGKRRGALCAHSCAQDHPRVCGEKVCKEIAPLSVWGSPPRMRGKVKTAKLRRRMTGITPAYAGKSRPGCRACGSRRDHPRVCGEKKDNPDEWSEVQGSPPRMRGKAARRAGCRTKVGITPAYAGKRLKRSHSIGHFSCILCLFHSVLHRASVSGGNRAGPCAPPCLPAQNAVPV